jgi:hypothetical protein
VERKKNCLRDAEEEGMRGQGGHVNLAYWVLSIDKLMHFYTKEYCSVRREEQTMDAHNKTDESESNELYKRRKKNTCSFHLYEISRSGQIIVWQ